MSCGDPTHLEQLRNLRDAVSELECDLDAAEAELASVQEATRGSDRWKAHVNACAERANHDGDAHRFGDFCARCSAEELLGRRLTKGLFT